MIELPLEAKVSGLVVQGEKRGENTYLRTTIVYIAVSIENLCRRLMVGR
jgi:hypothetical protein